MTQQFFKNISDSLKLCFKRKDGDKNTIQTSPFFKATLAWYDYPKEMFEEVDPSHPSCFYTTDFPLRSPLSDGAIAGIVVGVLLAMVLLVAVVVYSVVKQRQSQKRADVAGEHVNSSY